MNIDLDFAKYKELLTESIMSYIPKIILVLVILFVGFRMVRLLMKIVNRIFIKQRIIPVVRGFLNSFIAIILKILILITVAVILGVPTTSFIAILGAAGLAIGLSLQGSLANFAGGVLILLFRPFRVGDYIATSSHKGAVEKVTIFNTTLITTDNKAIIIPNGDLSNKEIVNYTAKKIRRVDLTFGVSYDSDIHKVREILMKVVKADKRILKDPAPDVLVGKLADSSVNFLARPWCKTEDFLDVKYDLIEKVKIEFDKEKVSIPYPQMDVHMKE